MKYPLIGSLLFIGACALVIWVLPWWVSLPASGIAGFFVTRNNNKTANQIADDINKVKTKL